MWGRRLPCLLALALAACTSLDGLSDGADPKAPDVMLDATDAIDADGTPSDGGLEAESEVVPGTSCSGTATVDQEHGFFEGSVALMPDATLGQSFIVSRDGTLASIEIMLGACDYKPQTGDGVKIEVFDGVVPIASATGPLGSGSSECMLGGTGYMAFDLSSACAQMKAQRMYRYTLSAVAASGATSYEARAGVSHQNSYASGSASVAGTTFAFDDYVFKVSLR